MLVREHNTQAAMVDDIRKLNTTWQTRIGVTGEVLQGLDALDQFIRTILATQLRSVPHMLDLGIDWLAIIDQPIDDAVPLLARDTQACFRKWIEPRATLQSIEPVTDGAHLTARIHYLPAGSDAARVVEVIP